MEKERDYLFDNIKGLLILLVVFGHMIESFVFKKSTSINVIYYAIYTFHMPVFIFISGYFSKKNNKRRILELIFVYIIWQMIICPLVISICTLTPFKENLQSIFLPQWTYWYLFSLITWKIITPYFEKIKFNFAISIVLGVLIGFSTLDSSLSNFSLSRSIAFYPFFLLGYYCSKDKFYNYRNKLNKYVGFIGFVCLVTFAVLLLYYFSKFAIVPKDIRKTLFLRDIYSSYMKNANMGALIRIIFYGIQFLCIPLLSSFISKNKSILSTLGRNTLLIYLTHGLAIKILRKLLLNHIITFNSFSILIICFILSSLYCLILSLKPFYKIGKNITKADIFLKPEIKK